MSAVRANMSTADTLFTAAARRHAAYLFEAIAPLATRLERRFAAWLRGRKYDAAVCRAARAVTPAAAARLGSLERFAEQVEYNGRRLAKCNVPPGEIHEGLRELGGFLETLLDGAFAPSREQLFLATVLALDRAYYQVRESETQVLFGIYRAETEATGPEDLMRRLTNLLTRAFHARVGRLALFAGPLTAALARPLYCERGARADRSIASPDMRGRYASYWSYPLGEAAAIQLGFAVRYPWLPRERSLLAAAAERCRAATDRAALEARVRRLEIERREAEEQERRRIGRELHDEAGQMLLLLRLRLEMMERTAPGPQRAQLAEARSLVEHTVVEIRHIVAALSPALLERLGLVPALRQLAARMQKLHPATVTVRIAAGAGELPRQIQEVIYRAAQESLQNIAKHSQASAVNLLLQLTDKLVRLRVTDNGTGFRLDPVASRPKSFGLAGMRERAALLGGTLSVRSALGKGTRVVLELPLDPVLVKRNVKDSRTTH